MAVSSYPAALRQIRPALGLAGLFSGVVGLLMLTGSIYMLQVYDRVLGSGSVPTLLGLFGLVVVLYGFLGLYDFLRARILGRAAMRLDQAMGGAVFARALDQQTPDGARGMRDLEQLRGFLSGPAVTGLLDAPWVPFYLAILFLVHPLLGWLTLAGAGVVAALAFAAGRLTRGPIRAAAGADGAERSFTEEARRGAEAIHAMGMGEAVAQVWQGRHRATLAAHQQAAAPSEAISATSRAFRMLLQSAILTLGAYLVLGQEISAGMIVASSILSGRALAPVDQVIGQWRAIGAALGAHGRLHEDFAVADPAPPRVALPKPRGEISVQGLTKLSPAQAGQKPSERVRMLTQVSFHLEAGDALGVIGHSACGKSTLARILAGVWTADAGELRFDGATPDQWTRADLGRAIGYLPQQVVMLPGTIAQNIARFDPDPQSDAVMAAARLAGVHEMILKLPQGYDTPLGGGSVPLSGGQMQRLGLARALYGDPGIVVLDEPNSNLDAAGDDALSEAIKTLRARGATVIVMAHRPSAIAAVNKVLLLKSGTVADFGSKQEVLRRAQGGGAKAEPKPPENAARPSPTAGSAMPSFVPKTAKAPAASAPAPVPASSPAPNLRLSGQATGRIDAGWAGEYAATAASPPPHPQPRQEATCKPQMFRSSRPN
ncbi:MAG: type I secretion system permease/ATPase [Paracoccaceae bacterium]